MTLFALGKCASLKCKVLGGIFVVFFLTIGLVLYGVLTYQRDKLVRMNSQYAMQTGQLIVAGLSSSMLQNDRDASMDVIKKMLLTSNISQISVLNKQGKIVVTSEASLSGKVFEKNTADSCLICHGRSSLEKRDRAVLESPDQSSIRAILPIENKPECFECHSQETKITGILFVDSSLESVNTLLKDMTRRILVTAFFVFVLGIVIINFIVTRFFTRPLEALHVGFEKVRDGIFDYWVNVKCGGEISYMADSFNVMTMAIKRYLDEIKLKSNEINTLYSIVQKMSLTIERKRLNGIIVDLLREVLQAKAVSLALPVDNNQNNVFEIITKHMDEMRHYYHHFNVESDMSLNVNCVFIKEDFLRWSDLTYSEAILAGDGSRLFFPLQLKNMLVGLVSVKKGDGEIFSLQEKKMIPVLTHHTTISLANSHLYEMAVTDELTSLYTKRYFLQAIKGFVEEYSESKKSFCLIMIDLDHFKQTNDTFGHLVGDRVLAQFGMLLMANVRHGDIACRYGGEEFAVLVDGEDSAEAGKVAERIRKQIAEFAFTIDDLPAFQKTVSIGLACCTPQCCSVENIIMAADCALYSAKKGGRNRVVIYDEEKKQLGAAEGNVNNEGC
ncbi:MAG: diguanylate cyclase [Thermodesulfobacteriota bacterium]